MQISDLDTFKKWFVEYTRTFYTDNVEDFRNIDLKVRHTYFVCENIVGIAKDEQFGDNDLRLAETVALFHDIGRFLQYSRYRTFRDSISVNHGRLGAEVLDKENMLSSLPLHEQQLIMHAVRFHNAFEAPSSEDQQNVLFLKLIRDADKLDIWRVFLEYYESPQEEQPTAVSLGLPDQPAYSKTVLACLYEKKPVSFSGLKTLNDFKLMQLSWVYDLNFGYSFRLLADRAYIRKLAAVLPQSEEIAGAISVINKYVDEETGVNIT